MILVSFQHADRNVPDLTAADASLVTTKCAQLITYFEGFVQNPPVT